MDDNFDNFKESIHQQPGLGQILIKHYLRTQPQPQTVTIPPHPAPQLALPQQRLLETIAIALDQAGTANGGDPKMIARAIQKAQMLLKSQSRGAYHLPGADDLWMFRDVQPPDPDWVVEGLEPGDIGILSGPGGVGKSMFCLSIMAAVAGGTDLFGVWQVNKPGDVLYLYAEDSSNTVWRRFHALAQGLAFSDDVISRMHTVCIKNHAPKLMLQGAQGLAVPQNDVVYELSSQLHSYPNPRLLILDPLVKLHTLEENANGQMNQFLDLVASLSDAAGIATIITHHVSKGSVVAGGALQQSARGASAIVDESRWQVSLSKLDPKTAGEYDIPDDSRWKYLLATSPKVNGTGQLPDLLLERQPDSGVLLLSPLHFGSKPTAKSQPNRQAREDHDEGVPIDEE